MFSLAFRNFERVLLAGYRWLSVNYKPGDKVFIFGELGLRKCPISLFITTESGFSRGAYQARVLAAMIKKVHHVYSWQLINADRTI